MKCEVNVNKYNIAKLNTSITIQLYKYSFYNNYMQYLANHKVVHIGRSKHIIMYLKFTLDVCIKSVVTTRTAIFYHDITTAHPSDVCIVYYEVMTYGL